MSHTHEQGVRPHGLVVRLTEDFPNEHQGVELVERHVPLAVPCLTKVAVSLLSGFGVSAWGIGVEVQTAVGDWRGTVSHARNGHKT